jgi:hypothetical protein
MWRTLFRDKPYGIAPNDIYFNKPAGLIALCVSLWAYVPQDAGYADYSFYHPLNLLGVAVHFGIPLETLRNQHPGLSWTDIARKKGVVTAIVHTAL